MNKINRVQLTKDFLLRERVEKGKTWSQISKETNWPCSTLTYKARRMGLDYSQRGGDLTDKEFGNWKVISKANSDSAGRSRWLCQCKCGSFHEVDAHTLQKGTSTKCNDCKYRYGSDHVNWKGFAELSGSMWNRIKKAASDRKGSKSHFAISQDYAWNLFLSQNRRCALTGLPLSFGTSYLAKKYSETTASLDRIDSNQGYIEGNIQWVHKVVNKIKQDLANGEFINFCHLVSQRFRSSHRISNRIEEIGTNEQTLPVSGSEGQVSGEATVNLPGEQEL